MNYMYVYGNYKPTRYEGKGFFEESKHQDTQGYYRWDVVWGGV